MLCRYKYLMLVVLCAVQFGNVVVAAEGTEEDQKGAAASFSNSDVCFDARDRETLQWFLSLANGKPLKQNLDGGIGASNERAKALDAAKAAIDNPDAHHFFSPVRKFLTNIMEQQQPLDDQVLMGKINEAIKQSEQQDRDRKVRDEKAEKQREVDREKMRAALGAWMQSDTKAGKHVDAAKEIMKGLDAGQKNLGPVDLSADQGGLGMMLAKGVAVIVIFVGFLWCVADRTPSSNARV